MTAHGMVCHLSDQMRVALNDVVCKRHDNLLSRTLARWLVIHPPLPTPRGRIQTAPEMQQTAPADWASDVASCEELLGRVGGSEASGIHPAFGPLSDRERGHRRLEAHGSPLTAVRALIGCRGWASDIDSILGDEVGSLTRQCT
jgi:hypothetical protein